MTPRWWPVTEFWLVGLRRVWRGTMVSGVLGPLLNLGAIGVGVGALVDRTGQTAALGGGPYARFVAPGILASAAMMTAVGDATWPVMGAKKWQRQYLAMLATPLGVAQVYLGHLVFIAVRLAILAAIFVAIGFGLGAFASPWVVLALPAAVLVGLAHAAPVMGYAITQQNDTGFIVLFRFGVLPMTLFAGTLFPIGSLPVALQALAALTPLWHGTQLCRALAQGQVRGAGVVVVLLAHLAYLSAWVLVGGWWARRRFARELVQ